MSGRIVRIWSSTSLPASSSDCFILAEHKIHDRRRVVFEAVASVILAIERLKANPCVPLAKKAITIDWGQRKVLLAVWWFAIAVDEFSPACIVRFRYVEDLNRFLIRRQWTNRATTGREIETRPLPNTWNKTQETSVRRTQSNFSSREEVEALNKIYRFAGLANLVDERRRKDLRRGNLI